MKIICDSCQTKYSIADEKVQGKVFKIKCKKCMHVIVVRGAAANEARPEEKETRVFDYGDGAGPDAGYGAASSGAVWHLVIDQEQVGPMTAAEVGDRFQRGVVDGESYIWREGFGDWMRLAAVEDFASLVAAGDAAANGAVGGLFGGASLDDGAVAAAHNDPADLFSAAAGAADVGGGLFGGGAGEEADAGDGLFGGGGGGGGEVAASAARSDDHLTGQRNENSVLFSLSNLASLASDAPRPAPAAPSPSSLGPSSGGAQHGGQEGSGLIDIRSMASVYLADKDGHSPGLGGGPAAAADLPVFSQSAFGDGQVLLPTGGASAANNKLLYALVGLVGVLVVVAAVLVVIVLTGRGDGTQVAAASDTVARADEEPAGDPSGGALGGGADSPKSATAGGGDTAGGGEADDPGEAAGGGGEAGDGRAAAETAPPTPSGSDRSDSDRASRDRESRRSSGDSSSSSHGGSNRSSRKREDPSRSSRSSSTAASAEPPPKAAKQKCDEVACLVDPSLPCCKGSGGGDSSSSRSSGKDSGKDASLPSKPSRAAIASGMASVRGRVQSCGDRHGFKGTVTVKVKVAGSGSVAGVQGVSKGTPAFKSCVESSVRNARFQKSQDGVTVNYPFIVR